MCWLSESWPQGETWEKYDTQRSFKESEKVKVRGKLIHQTIASSQSTVPNWWNPRWFQFVGKVNRMPFDSHTMKALIAPRALVNQCGRQDDWTNPYGTELTYRAADKVFAWLGAKEQQGIHWRDGGHAMNIEDWTALLDFADWKFFSKKPERSFSALNHPDAPLPIHWDVPSASQARPTDMRCSTAGFTKRVTVRNGLLTLRAKNVSHGPALTRMNWLEFKKVSP